MEIFKVRRRNKWNVYVITIIPNSIAIVVNCSKCFIDTIKEIVLDASN